MRCLQCGKELALLKKLTAGEFCSPEHRTTFYDRLQRETLQKLADTAYRLNSKTRLQVAASRDLVAAVDRKKKEAEKRPPFAELIPVSACPDAQYSETLAFIRDVAFDHSDLLIIPPEYRYIARRRRQPALAAAMIERLFAVPGKPYRQIRAEFSKSAAASAVHLEHLLPIVGHKLRFAPGVTRPSDPVTGSPGRVSPHAPQFSSFEGNPVGPEFHARGSSALGGGRLRPLEGPDSRLGNVDLHGETDPAEQTGSTAVPDLQASAPSGLRTHGSPFRFRPKGPVADVTLPDSESIVAAPEQVPGAPLIAGLASDGTSLAPGFLDRPFRMRPKAGVSDGTLPDFHPVHPAATVEAGNAAFSGLEPDVSVQSLLPRTVDSALSVSPGAPAYGSAAVDASSIDASRRPELYSRPFIPSDGCVPPLHGPRFLDRAFRMRPRAGVDSGEVANAHSIDPGGFETLTTPVAFTDGFAAAGADHSPVALDRTFRMRPRGPVADVALPQHSAIAANALAAAAGTAHLPALAHPEPADLAPSTVNSPFRMRPRGPVLSSDLSDFESIAQSDIESLQSDPRNASLPAEVIGNCVPVPVDRAFRMRPRGGISDPSQPEFESIASGSTEVFPAVPDRGHLADVMAECAPNVVDRPFRMRPRAGIADPAQGSFEQVSSGDAATLASEANRGRIFGDILPACAPNVVDRPFRMRPRAGIASASVPSYEQIRMAAIEKQAGAPVFAPVPVQLGECAAASLDKPFRMRPRGPLACESIADREAIPTGEWLAAPQDAAIVGLPVAAVESEPRWLDRLFRMRPRVGVADPAVASFEQIAAGDPENGSADVSKGAYHRTSAAMDPRTADQPFRMRPRGPVADAALSSFERIRSNVSDSANTALAFGSLPVSVGDDLVPPMRQRAFVMRPRGGVNSGPSTSQIGAQSVFPKVDVKRAAGIFGNVTASYEPGFTDKLYRMRPRGPVQAAQASIEAIDPGAIELVLPLPVMPAMPCVLMRQAEMVFRERPIKMKPRGPKPSSTSPNSEKIEPVAEAGSDAKAAASCSALEPNALGQQQPLIRDLSGEIALQCTGIRGVAVFRPELTVAPEAYLPNAIMPEPFEAPRAFWPEAEIFAQTLSDGLGVHGALALSHVEHVALPLRAVAPVLLVEPVSATAAIAKPSSEPLPIALPRPERPAITDLATASEPSMWRRWLNNAVDFWQPLPLDQKLAGAIGAMVVACLVYSVGWGIHPPADRTFVMQTADATPANPLPPIEDAFSKKWGTLQPVMKGRAAVDLRDDFSTGFGNWKGATGTLRGWTRQQSEVNPGELAFFVPSINMADYDLQFIGQVKHKALSWVVRAADRKNYYVLKLQTIKSGRMPTINLVRYAVINGKEGPRTVVPLQLTVSSDTVYRVAMEVAGESFTVAVQDQVVDRWTSNALKTGGIGFFSGKGEQGSIEVVRVSHQDDALGKFFALVSK